jgi:hypothetical protein
MTLSPVPPPRKTPEQDFVEKFETEKLVAIMPGKTGHQALSASQHIFQLPDKKPDLRFLSRRDIAKS